MSADPQHLLFRRISICVDDFGMHDGINQAALELATRGHISAISCMVDGPAWPAGSDNLKDSGLNVETGLHLNFTEDFGQTLASVPLPQLILSAYARTLDRESIRQDIERQLDQFESSLGRMPDFIDGHQHVHQLPVIRDALVDVLNQRCAASKPWLRASGPPEQFVGSALLASDKFKSRLIGWLGAAAFSQLARKHDFRQNRHLLGVYGFDATEGQYAAFLRDWLHSAVEGDLLMCHPSVPGTWDDPLIGARTLEYSVLSSQTFAELLGRAGFALGSV